ncbi:hypothetical protein BMF94_3079 [Rhodotorula taiwanensis]|uniref:Uncharacterized protein n=1 Tax=Rhodotorula taiwanensis TaxID=741276 RepID=A0A2S5BAX1_9BASI|nr:hypothetical protein BMF94_3079 [Rhodotorula taiwanensis]
MNSKPTIKIEQPSAGADWTHTAAIAIGNGDAPIPPYLVFATERGYVPPLVLLTNDELKRGAATSRGYLDFQFRPDWASQERPWERWLEAICWLSLDEFLPALAKLCFLVKATLCAAISTRETVDRDVGLFLGQLCVRLTVPGSWQTVRRYALLKLREWRQAIHQSKLWTRMVLSTWDECLWTKACTGSDEAGVEIVATPDEVAPTSEHKLLDMTHETAVEQSVPAHYRIQVCLRVQSWVIAQRLDLMVASNTAFSSVIKVICHHLGIIDVNLFRFVMNAQDWYGCMTMHELGPVTHASLFVVLRHTYKYLLPPRQRA